jgi:hypothetical protein
MLVAASRGNGQRGQVVHGQERTVCGQKGDGTSNARVNTTKQHGRLLAGQK